MRGPRTATLLAALLATLVIVTAAGPVGAHPAAKVPDPAAPAARDIGLDVVASDAASVAVGDVPDSTTPVPLAAAVTLAIGTLAVGAIAALMRRRSRRALAVALVGLLTIFAFENALHSVHHGFDAQQSSECAVAAVAAQLAAVSVDSVAETALVLAVAGTTAEPGFSCPSIRLLGPDQDRAPPLPSA
jgi:xanthosine utilization system XapX-like protein